MARKIHVAIGSTMSRPGRSEENLDEIRRFARQAASDGADLLLTPEMSATGYGSYPEVLALAEPAGGGALYRSLAHTAHETGVVVCAGFVEADGEKRYLSHYVVYPDGRHVVQRKHRVTRVELPLDSPARLTPKGDEKDPADRGQPDEVFFNYFDVRDVRCVITICADSGIDDLNDLLAANGVELVLLPTGAGGRREDRVTTADLHTEEGRQKYLKVLETVFFPGRAVLDCIKYRRAMAAVNQCGFDGRALYHVGHGSIINPMGEVVGLVHGLPNLDRQRPMYTHAVIDLDENIDARKEPT